MAKYTITGTRWLRKYTAKTKTPSYAAASDAQLVADSMCDIAWERTSASYATMASHSVENQDRAGIAKPGVDWNADDRESFDAASWCAEHSGGAHRVYANAACYKFTFPDGTLPNLTKLTVKATSDPYNASGLRIAIATNATGEIPTACAVVRNNDSQGQMKNDGRSKDKVAKRIETGTAPDVTWYTNSEPADLEPTTPMALSKYLYVFVTKELYSEYRGSWIEGCGFIRNQIEIETSDGMPGWTDGEKRDCSEVEVDNSAVTVMNSGKPPALDEVSLTGMRKISTGEAGAHGMHAAYRIALEGGGTAETGTFAGGAEWRIRKTVEGWEISAGALVVPFVMPRSPYGRVRISHPSLSMTNGAKFRVFFKDEYDVAATEDLFKNAGLWTGEVDGFSLLGEITGGNSSTFPIPYTTGMYATLVIVGYMPPEKVAQLDTTAWQGTTIAFIPKVEVV